MPWAYPDSPDSVVDLIKAVDRKHFAAHLDPVNIVSSPQRYYNNGALIRECFEKFGNHIKSCHAKDIVMSQDLTVHLDETLPGKGNLDYAVYLKELSKLNGVPLMLEHLSTEDEYNQAAKHIRSVAKDNGLEIS
jgi:sugar phosphate isomerase/epimerase